MEKPKLIIALPKGRILEELSPILAACNIVPEDSFFDKKSRLLRFTTNDPQLDIIRVRAFDVATFTAFGAAHLGVAGSDVIDEFSFPELYAPVDLKIGLCRLSVAMRKDCAHQTAPKDLSHVRIATKYPHLTQKYFASQGIQTECIKLNGAMEIAPLLGLASRIVDLVSTGSTLKANGLVERQKIADVSSRLIVNRTAMKTMPDLMGQWVSRFRMACSLEL